MDMWTLSLGPEMDFGRTLNPSIAYAELFVDVHICIFKWMHHFYQILKRVQGFPRIRTANSRDSV